MAETMTSYIVGTPGDDLLVDAPGDTVLDGLAGNDAIVGQFGDGNDIMFGRSGDDIIIGGDGNDRVYGGEGNDFVLGTSVINSQPVRDNGQIDILTGDGGTDTFFLGAILPNGLKSVFYNDDDLATAGVGDYALIADFGWGSPAGEDKDLIQLVGTASNYSLGVAPTGLSSGTGIFLNDGSTPKLLAIVAGVSPSDLSLANASQFTFI